MAIRSSPHTIFPRSQTSKAATKVSTLCNSHIQPNRTAAALIRSCSAKKVFEDQAMGIVCYQDEHGEVICEGLDEGPRYSRRGSPDIHQESLRRQRDIQIPNLPLQRRKETNRGPSVLCINGFAAHEQDKQ